LITAVGLNLSIDRTIEVPRLIPYGTNRALSTRSDPGGKAVNVALMAARLGAQTAVTGFMRKDSADLFEQKLCAGGVKTDFVNLDGQMRVNVKVLDCEAGAVTEFNEAGAPVSEAALERICARVGSLLPGGWLVLTGSLPPGCPEDFYLRLMRAAPGCAVVLDAEGTALNRALEGKPSLVKPNRRELEGLVGRQLESLNEVCRGAMELIERGAKSVVVSLGEMGALMVDRSMSLFAPPAKVPVRSTVGAGDAMVAGLVVGLASGLDGQAAFKMGAAAAGAAVSTEGTQAASLEAYKHIHKTISIEKVM
jgi:1-phosphofructokinase